ALVLRVAGAGERLADELAHRRGDVGHAATDDAGDFDEALLGQAGVREGLRAPGGLEVGLAVDLLVGLGEREAEGLPLAIEEARLDAGLLSDFAGGVL